MNAVGIDVSKGKSMVAALRPMGEVALLPQEFLHTEVGLEQMAYAIIALGEDTRVVMEATGRYHEPVAAALHEYGIYVCVLNPLYIKQSGGGSIRKVKTDKADAMKIAKYGLDNWVDLREYTPMDTVRQLEMSRNVQSGNTQNLKSMVIQRSFPKWSVAERRKTAAASDQAAVCACAHSRYFAGGSPSGLRV